MISDRDVVVTSLEAAIVATLGGHFDEAAVGLKGIIALLDKSSQIRKSLSLATQLEVFQHDHFTCRYCGKLTIFAPAARIVSALYPDALPYHPHGKYGKCHRLYWTHTASVDHVRPVASFEADDIAAGQDPNDVQNLTTACYECNDRKGNLTLEQLGWPWPLPADVAWDGLSRLYPRLYKHYAQVRGAAPEPYFYKWLRAVESTQPVGGSAGR
jgi:5-methylcytosine-specific restriction endonuclease McrA